MIKTYVYRLCNISAMKTIMEAVGGRHAGHPGFYEVVYVNEIYSSNIKSYAQMILEPHVGYIFQFVHANENTKGDFISDEVKSKLKDINIKFKQYLIIFFKTDKPQIIYFFLHNSESKNKEFFE